MPPITWVSVQNLFENIVPLTSFNPPLALGILTSTTVDPFDAKKERCYIEDMMRQEGQPAEPLPLLKPSGFVMVSNDYPHLFQDSMEEEARDRTQQDAHK